MREKVAGLINEKTNRYDHSLRTSATCYRGLVMTIVLTSRSIETIAYASEPILNT